MKTPAQKGPWHVTSSDLKYENAWISVREDVVIGPDGLPGTFGVVTVLPGVAVVLPIDSEHNVYLVKRYRYGSEQYSIEAFSAVYGEGEGEDKVSAAKRQLKTEIGLTAGELIELGSVDPLTDVVKAKSYLYLARKLEHAKPEPDEADADTEEGEILKVPYLQALQWARDSTITHSASVVAILRAEHFIETVLYDGHEPGTRF